jgi:hypothetical protein
MTSASHLRMTIFSTFTAIMTDGPVRGTVSKKNAKTVLKQQQIIYFQDIT